MINLPVAFKEKYQALLSDEEATKLFASLNEPTKKAFRINSLKFQQKVGYSLDKKVPVIPHAFYGEVAGEDPEWVSGTVYSQDPAAMFPAYLAKVQPGQKVLDLCAAPGGKTTALAENLKGGGLLVANEISVTRAKALRENLERWGVSNVLITNNDSAALSKKFPQFFDTILVDAPCSGEGMFRKNPDAIKYWSPEYVLTCQKRQKEILTATVKMLKPGGKLVYSTCTFSPEEDEAIVDWLVKKYGLQIEAVPELASDQISHGNPDYIENGSKELKRTFRFWPQDNLGEGQFAAVLTMPGQAGNQNKKKKRNKKENNLRLTRQEQQYVADILSQFNLPTSLANWSQDALVRKEHVFVPAITGNLSGLKIVNNGVELGILKKKRFEPGHQLAEVLGQVEQKQVYDLVSTADYHKYLHGETINVKTNLKGFVLVSYQNFIFSFGKITGNGILKNFYPKGLRTMKGE